MRNVTPKRVLPDWAIAELGVIAREEDWRIDVKPMGGLDQVGIKVMRPDGDHCWTKFLVTMRRDWTNLQNLREGDLSLEIYTRLGDYFE